MEKIRDILHRFGRTKYDETPDSLLRLFRDAWIKKQDEMVKALVYPDSPILSAVGSDQRTALHGVCYEYSSTDVIQTLIDLGMNIDAQDKFGNTPLHTAVEFGVEDLTCMSWCKLAITIFLKNGANRYVYNEDGVTPFQMALLSGCVEAVKIFLEKEEEVQVVDEEKRTQHLIKRLFNLKNDLYLSSGNYSALLHFVFIQNNVEAFEYVIHNNDFDVNAINFYYSGYCSFGHTLLHLVVEAHDTHSAHTPRMIKALVNRGANPDAYNLLKENTPLFYPILEGQAEIIQCLLDCGASINLNLKYDDTVLTPLHCAIVEGRFEIIKLLVNRGADLEAKSAEGKTALDHFCRSANLDAVKLLLRRGAKITKSTLHHAIKGDDPAIVRLVLEGGANVNYRRIVEEKHHQHTTAITPLHYAILEEQDTLNTFCIIDILLKNGADVNAADSLIMETPLHLALFSNYRDKYRKKYALSHATMIKRLLKSKANVNALDGKGLTPLSHALHNHYLRSDPNMTEDHRNSLKPDLKILIALIVKMIVTKEWVCEENLKLLDDKFVLTIYQECEEEITLMKKNICESLNFSFLNILTRDIDDLGGALKNKDLVQGLEVCDYKKNFPIYGEDLEERLQEAKLRKPLVETGVALFRKHLKKNISLEVVLEIFRNLNLQDLENFAEAYFVNVRSV